MGLKPVDNDQGFHLGTDQAVCGTYAFLRLEEWIGLLAAKYRSVLKSNG
jgi:hypothetical protein